MAVIEVNVSPSLAQPTIRFCAAPSRQEATRQVRQSPSSPQTSRPSLANRTMALEHLDASPLLLACGFLSAACSDHLSRRKQS